MAYIVIPELEKPETAEWLALLIDTKGAMGWSKGTERRNRIDKEYRHTRVYRVPYVTVGMSEKESKETVDRAARLMGASARTRLIAGVPVRDCVVGAGRALSVIRYTKPYHVKFKRMTSLLLTLFKEHTHIPIREFDAKILSVFGEYLTPKMANERLLDMTEEEFSKLLESIRS